MCVCVCVQFTGYDECLCVCLQLYNNNISDQIHYMLRFVLFIIPFYQMIRVAYYNVGRPYSNHCSLIDFKHSSFIMIYSLTISTLNFKYGIIINIIHTYVTLVHGLNTRYTSRN